MSMSICDNSYTYVEVCTLKFVVVVDSGSKFLRIKRLGGFFQKNIARHVYYVLCIDLAGVSI